MSYKHLAALRLGQRGVRTLETKSPRLGTITGTASLTRCLTYQLAALNRKKERLNAVPLTLLFSLLNTYALATFLIQEEIATDFDDLGNLLLGGFVLAVAVAVALTFVRLRLRAKKGPTSEFISISSVERKE